MRTLLATLTLLALPTLASADAIEGPPACPRGAHGRTSHSGQWCEPLPCTGDGDCSDGARCEPVRMCTVTASIPPGGRRRMPGPGEPPETPYVATLAVASCDAAASCTGTEEPWPPTAGNIANRTPSCATARMCVMPPLPSLGDLLAGEPTPEAAPAPPPEAAPAPAPSPAPSSCSVGGATPAGWLALALPLLALAWRRR